MIKWSAYQVNQGLSNIEKTIDDVEPILREIQVGASEVAKIHNLPSYMSEPLASLIFKVDNDISYLRCRIASIREKIPAKELAKAVNRYNLCLSLWEGDKEKAEVSMDWG